MSKLASSTALPGALYADESTSVAADVGVILSRLGVLDPLLAVEAWPTHRKTLLLEVPSGATWLELVDAP